MNLKKKNNNSYEQILVFDHDEEIGKLANQFKLNFMKVDPSIGFAFYDMVDQFKEKPDLYQNTNDDTNKSVISEIY